MREKASLLVQKFAFSAHAQLPLLLLCHDLQIDRIQPYLTVKEVCEFAWRCKSGGTHRKEFHGEGPEVDEAIAKMDKDMWVVVQIMRVLGLTRVKDTFVGDQSTVRGVSGGEKKRVTVAEMLVVSHCHAHLLVVAAFAELIAPTNFAFFCQ